MASPLRSMDYRPASRLRGESRWYIAIHDILPNMVHPMLTDFRSALCLHRAAAERPELPRSGRSSRLMLTGTLVRESMQGLFDGSPAVPMPALAIASLTIGANLLIDSLQAMRPMTLAKEGV